VPPRLARLLAAVLAIALVGGAFYLRGRNDDGGGGGGGSGSGSGDETFDVVCVPELEAVCERLDGDGLDVKVEPAGETADRLATEAADFDAWITIDPWPQMVQVVRDQDQRPAVFVDPVPLASSDLVLLLADDDQLSGACGWDCAVDASGEQRRIATPSMDDAFGPPVVGWAFASHQGTADYSRADIEDPEGAGWLDRLTAFTPNGAAEDQMATQGAAAYLAAGTTEQRATPALTSVRGKGNGLHLGSPEIPARADVVVAPVLGRDGGRSLVQRLTDQNAIKAFAADGWTAPAVEGATGLPAADLLVALREEIDR
jgi:hypothetical protein